MKRIALLSDLHAGHVVGLTPPDWQDKKPGKFKTVQSQCWDFYATRIKAAGPFDVVLVNGDCIDGRGDRSGSTEQITVDREEQCDMAIAAIKLACNSKTKLVFSHGTSYHTGTEEDWERLIAHEFNAKIGSHEWVDIDGVLFDLKHHCGSSSIPHGRHTAIARDRLWNMLWSEREQQPKSDVIIRSHVHYFHYCGGPDWMAMTTPALQGHGSKFGSRRCSGIVDFGFVVFEVSKGTYSWQPHIAKLAALKAQTLKL